jgi:hypothetical protein
MTDFFDELLERYRAAKAQASAIKAEYDAQRVALEARFNEALREANAESDALETLLRIEERTSERKLLPPKKKEERLSLADFFLTALHAHGRMSKDELRDQAERAGYFESGDSGGRATHATLLNLTRHGRIVEIEPGTYNHLLAEISANESSGNEPKLW